MLYLKRASIAAILINLIAFLHLYSQPVTRVEVSPKNPQMNVGETITFKATAFDAQDNQVFNFDPHWEMNCSGKPG